MKCGRIYKHKEQAATIYNVFLVLYVKKGYWLKAWPKSEDLSLQFRNVSTEQKWFRRYNGKW